MKKAKLFLGILLCFTMFFSCNKPEGEIVNPWGSDSNTFLTSVVKKNVDYAVHTTELNLKALRVDRLSVSEIALLYWETDTLMTPPAATDVNRVVVLKNMEFGKKDSVIRYRDTLPELKPNTLYGYQVVMTDDALMNDTLDGVFQTLDPTPSVSIDSAVTLQGEMICYATVGAYKRAFLDDPAYELAMFWGEDATAIDIPVAIDTMAMEDFADRDSLSMIIAGTTPISNAVLSVWFKMHVKDSWGNVVDSLHQVNRDPISTITSADADMSQWEQNGTVKLYGSAKKGADQNAVLYRCGFCYGLAENPSLDDNVVLATNPVWGPYTCEVGNLEPNTTYYYRSFLQVTDDNGPVYYSSVCQNFTTGNAPEPVRVVVGQEFNHSMIPAGYHFITASIEGDGSLVAERGYVWKARSGNDDQPITFDNCDGSMAGYTSSEIPSDYSLLLPLLGLNLGANDYLVITNTLDADTRYMLRAYLKLTDQRVVYSNGTLDIDPSSGK